MKTEGDVIRRALPEISEEDFAELDFERVRCNQCTPCCTYHTHFVHRGEILWACSVKLRNRKKENRS